MTKNIKTAKQMMDQMYLERDQTGDVTFLVESEQIRAHRLILATQSPKYMAQFYGPNPDVGEIRVPEVSAAAFNVFLQFFYMETVDLTMENIEMVLDLAHQSLVDEFVECCVNFLKDAVKADNNLCIVYQLAILYNIEFLRLECEQRISINTVKILCADDLRQCDREILLRILKMDTLNCDESYLLYVCLSWARAYCRRNGLDDSSLGNLRAALGDAIYQIRFSSFNAQEFAALHKSMEGFFKHDESIELFYITSKLTDFKPKKFNPNPRTPKIEPKVCPRAVAVPSTVWSLEVNRFTCMIRLPTKIQVRRLSSFSFNCDSPIRLHGFAIGLHFHDNELNNFSKNLSVEIGRDTGLLTTLQLKCKVYRCATRANEVMIVFEKPIERIKCFSCSFTLPFKRLGYEFGLYSFARVENIDFVLGGKWVTRLFFDKCSA